MLEKFADFMDNCQYYPQPLYILCYNNCIAHDLMGQNIDRCSSFRNDSENIDIQHLRPPVLAILLEVETVERNDFDGCTKSVNIFPIKTLHYIMVWYVCDRM